MTTRLITALVSAIALMVVAPNFVSAQVREKGQGDLPEREEIHRTYHLSPGARVDISTISGPVDIQTTDSDTAEVHIVRSAKTPSELHCYTMAIEYTPSRLAIH